MLQMNSLINTEITIVKQKKAQIKTMCEYCNIEVPNNVYTRNHGDKCSYNNAKEGYKFCRTCGREISLEDYYVATTNTFDGLFSTCRFCIMSQTKQRRENND